MIILMSNIDAAMDRIKDLECPNGELTKRVADILERHGITNAGNVKIEKDQELDNIRTQGFRVSLPGGESIIILIKSGYDDYVYQVVDAYLT